MPKLQSLIKEIAYCCGFSFRKLRSVKRIESTGSHTGQIRPLLHVVDPYDGLVPDEWPDDRSGWDSDSPVFDELVSEIRPNRVIEVGTWKGGSALTMAGHASRLGLNVEILCVDTWLGALEMWMNTDDAERYGSLRLKNGYPTVYYTFLANVARSGHQSMITPFPVPSVTAAQWCALHGIQADLIYLDGSHEEDDVYQDLTSWWELVKAGSVLFGDDWNWDGVRLAVQRFCRENNLHVSHRHDKWVLRKASTFSPTT